MSLGENVSTRVSYKFYSSGAMTANTLATSSSDLGASGGFQLRRTNVSLNFKKDTYQSNEIRTDRQISDFRHGRNFVDGAVADELSPGTHFDFIEAVCRGTRVAAVATTNSDFTTVSADSTTSKFTMTSGDPVALGYRVGNILRFTNLSESTNNSKNFYILSFGGSSNREITVYPAPTTMGGDSSFNLTSVGKRVSPPASSHVSRKLAIEEYHTDLGLMNLYTECRATGLTFNLPATGMATIEVPMMGRYMETGNADDTPVTAPFFSAPAASTTTGITAAVNGLVRVGGVNVGVVTGVTLTVALESDAPAVVGQNFVPEIFLKSFKASGQVTALFQDMTMVNYFKNETEVEILLVLSASSADAADAITIYLPRVKFGGADKGLNTDASIPLTMPFTALKYEGSTAGIENTTVVFNDTAAS